MNDAFYHSLLVCATAGEFLAIVAAPPCSTFSISRFIHSDSSVDGGPAPVRDRLHIEGLPNVAPQHQRELRRANRLTRRMAYILGAAAQCGTQFIIENPADRGDPSDDTLFIDERHGPIWHFPVIRLLADSASATLATFAQCMFGADTQKYTTFMYTPGFDTSLSPINGLRCNHPPGSHRASAGGLRNDNGTWNSRESAAFPADLNLHVAQSIASLVTDTPAPPPPIDSPPLALDTAAVDDDAVAPLVVAATAPTPNSPSPPSSSPPPSPLPTSPPQPTDRFVPRTDSKHNPAGRGRQNTRSSNTVLVGPEVIYGTARLARRNQRQLARAESRRCASDPRERAYCALSRHVLVAPAREMKAVHPHGRSLLASPSDADPRNRDQALRADRAGWLSAEKKELANHLGNKSWSEIDRSKVPKERRLVRLIWVYKVKRDGSLKARLCVQGCSQVPGIDYDQTFSAAMRSTSLRLLTALASRLDLHMRRWDFVAAYLQGELLPDEVVHCKMPQGYEQMGKDGRERICRIEKPVYGMAQAGRRWQRSIFPWLTSPEVGLSQCHADTCVFHQSRTVDTPSGPRLEYLIVGCYLDDLYILYSHDDEHSLYHSFTTVLAKEWQVEDEGPASDLLNIEIERQDGHILLHQTSYISKLMSTYAPSGIPTSHQAAKVPAGLELPQLIADALAYTDTPDPSEVRKYQSLVGALLYCATCTRPDIAYAVGMLCRAMSKPTPELYEAALRVLYYLERHKSIGLRYGKGNTSLSGMSDSDWAIKHSTSGSIFTFQHAAISWGSKKQSTVALSSCEAELYAGSEAAKEAVYLGAFLDELGLGTNSPIPLAMDNKAGIDLAYNPEHHQKTKHIERRHYFLREMVEHQRLSVPYVASADNDADIFTKPLQASAFYPLRNRIMNVSR